MHLVDITMFYAAEGGGVSTYLNAKQQWLAGEGSLRHTIVAPRPPSAADELSVRTLPGPTLPGPHGYRLPLAMERAARTVQWLRPDLIEAGDAGPCAWTAVRAAQRLGIPAIAFHHCDVVRLARARLGGTAAQATQLYLRNLYGRFDLVLAPSQFITRQLERSGIAALHQPLGFDPQIFRSERRDPLLRQRLGLPMDARLLVYAGRFTADKKVQLLVDAVRQLGPQYHLLLVGGGGKLDLHGRCTLLPFESDPVRLATLLASCDALVHPGDRETFGLIVIEAMACGLPVVVVQGGATSELVNEACGIITLADSVPALCEAISDLYRRDLPALAQAAQMVSARHSWNRVLPVLYQRYQELLAHRGQLAVRRELAYVSK
jgi:alpha-1,6-mannosyltransferase